ncbi:MAG: hypothetical protein KDA55_08805 [Planctomycetales bacterium]|nr:hypothetical protein [Planctomycetales bacterium]
MATERYHPLFVEDLRDACEYYDSIEPALGLRFRDSVRSVVREIVTRPESFGRIGGDFRGAMIRRFPYVVVFVTEGNCRIIYGLRHAASNRGDYVTRQF